MKSRIALVAVTAAVSVVVTSALWIVGIAVTHRLLRREPPPFAVTIDAPTEAAVGETITLKARVSNPTDERLQLGSIDVYDSLLDGFVVQRVEPEAAQRDHTLDFSTFYYSRTLAPGETLTVAFELKAARPGLWTGDVDICTPAENFVTSTVTIRVRAAPGSPAAENPQSSPGATEKSAAAGPHR